LPKYGTPLASFAKTVTYALFYGIAKKANVSCKTAAFYHPSFHWFRAFVLILIQMTTPKQNIISNLGICFK